MLRWFDQRTGVREVLKESLDEPIPGGARLAYVFGSGLLFIFISQIITGICLALYYVPSAETAHTSVAYITKQVAAGAFLRSLHYYGSSAMIVVLALHFLQTFVYGSFKGRRELLWISGAVLSFLVLAMGFTGYLLPWDQKAYFATAVGTNIVGQIPLIGNWLTRLLRGGDTIGTLTLSRFYVAHVFLIPAAIFLFIGAHIWLFRKAGPAGPIKEDPIDPKLPPEAFYPRQVIMDMAFALLIVMGLGVLSYFHPASLGPIADPADTHFLPRPEWYYLPMFEWLKFWEGPKVVFAVIVTPGILALVFFLLPFLDRSLERRPWRRPIPLLAVAFVVLGMVYLGVKSHLDDMRDPAVAAQLALQAQQEREYSKTPFQPYLESPGTSSPLPPASGPVDPLVAQGKGLFEAHGCSGCHGENGTGTTTAVSLVGETTKYPTAQLIELLHNPNAKMRGGGMPAVDISDREMSALLEYLTVLGTSAANVPAATGVPAPSTVAATKKSSGSRIMSEAPTASAEPATGLSSATIQAGRQTFQSHGCAACHGQAGLGTARVPPLAGLVASLSDRQLSTLLHHPNAKMRAGGMPPFVAPLDQESSLKAYMRSLAPAKRVEARQEPGTTPAPVEQAATAATAPSPAQPIAIKSTAAQTSTVSAANGRAIFVANGCAACHGQNGTGTHFAPSLVGITLKYPDAKLSDLLHHPNSKMRDGGMPPVTVSGTQMQQLTAYLGSLGVAPSVQPQHVAAAGSAGSIETQIRPAGSGAAQGKLSPAASQSSPPLSAEATRGSRIFQHYSCQTCHGVGGLQGTVAAPGLAGTASILPAPVLENLLRHHSVQMQEGGMPLTNINSKDMKALVAYIRSLPSNDGTQ